MDRHGDITYAFQYARTKGWDLKVKLCITHIDNIDSFDIILQTNDNGDIVCIDSYGSVLSTGCVECLKLLSIFNITSITYAVSSPGKIGLISIYDDTIKCPLDFSSAEFCRCFWVEVTSLVDQAECDNRSEFDYSLPSP